MSQPKVFEFAKEIGMETLALMDKIREWKLPVRSHMAELDPELMEQIRSRLATEKTDKAAVSPKKKVVKKAAASADTGEETVKKPAAKAVAKKVTKTPAANGHAEPAEKATGGKKSSVVVKKAAPKIVVRRKADEEEIPPEELAPAEPTVEMAPAEVVEEPVAVAATPEPVEPEAPRPVVMEPAVVPPAPAPAPAAPVVEDADKRGPATPARKREVVMTASGPVSGVKSDAPRRNIIGRMDLSRVAPPPGASGGYQRPQGGPGGPPGAGPRASNPRNLRAGFVAPTPTILPVDLDFEDQERKRQEGKLRNRLADGAATRDRATIEEEQVKNFSSTEFRKREMVFQPKKKKGTLNREARKTEITTPKASKRIVKINQTMKVSDLANEMGVKAAQIVKNLMGQGMMATMNTDLDFDTIALIVPEYGFEAQNVHKSVQDLVQASAFGDLEAETVIRPPVVTVMGHVDHGKTSLLDAIRKANVAAGEAGGITQHIGAYQIKTDDGHVITFIDTPGHEAFTAMRARGANVTDIAIIVVAADDGVMPQTAEAINHAKAAEVPIIVAVNKMDKAGANPDRIKQQMTEFELVPEEWGGSTIFCPVSAVQKTGIKELLEQIYLLAEIEELKANPKRSATGIVIESRLEKGRGPVATLLVQDGTLSVGQALVAGAVSGRVRSLMNERGERLQEAGPSVPVEVLGLQSVPAAGDRFDICESETQAAQIAETRLRQQQASASQGKVSLEDLFSKLQQGDLKELAIVLKTDVAGSVEAIRGMFDKLSTSEVKIKLVHAAIGGISESDVLLASTAKGIVVGFNVRPDGGAQSMAKREGVEIKTYTIVYELMDDIKKAMSGLLAPTVVEKSLGRAEVRNTFSVPKFGMIAGCAVTDGKVLRSAQVRLVRDGKIIYTGKISSLKRFKDDAKEVASGFECGIGIENYNDIKVGDVIEAFHQESIAREI